MNWSQQAQALRIDTRAFVNGKRVEATCNERFDSVNPHDGSIVASLPASSESDVNIAVASAKEAFEEGEWSRISPYERGRVLMRLSEVIASNLDELALLDCLEMGMPISSALAVLPGAVAEVRNVAELISKLGEELLSSGPHTLSLNLRVPHGVVAAISPWNFPFYIAMSQTVSALAMGNSVVLKPSELASLSSLRLGDMAAEAGIPAGVLNVIPGLGKSAGRGLALHDNVDCLTFTGSTTTGRLLMGYAGRSNLKSVILECGGKSPQIVFDDLSDIDAVAQALVHGFAWNSGQVCVAGTRILVTRHLYEPLVARMTRLVEALRTGPPLDPQTELGPLASLAQVERVESLVQFAKEGGARILAGGARLSSTGACHFQPTLFADASMRHPLMQEEIFGPVAGVIPFDSAEQALAMANDTRYGLSATVWTRDFSLAHGLARRLRGGPITVNMVAAPRPAFVIGASVEPMGASGFGAIGGVAGLLAYTRARNITFNL